MNVLELIAKLTEIQEEFEKRDKEYYSTQNECEYNSPDIRIEDLEDLENKWLESVCYNSGSGYEEHPEVVLDWRK